MTEVDEAALLELHRSGAFKECLTAALERYDAELRGFLRARANEVDVAECHAAVLAALVEALPRFEWRSSLRTWMYQVARFTQQRIAERERMIKVPLSQVSDQSKLIARRSEPPSHLGEAAEARLLQLRAELEEEDRELLYLRIDREMEWLEIARATSEGAVPEEVLTKKSAALRKRFERIKQRIREALVR